MFDPGPQTCPECGTFAGERGTVGGEYIQTADGLMPAGSAATWYQQPGSADTDWSEAGHLTLDGIGLIPGGGEVSDFLNGAWYAAEGDMVNASFSFGAMVPGPAGWGSTLAKWGKRTENATDAAKRIPCNSFDGDTPVLMADGTTKPIEDVKVGDEVLATDPETGQTEARAVTDTHTKTSERRLVDITIKGETGADKTITATDEHPFWDAGDRIWRHAADLQPNDLLRTDDGDYVRVQAIHTYTKIETVYNLTIDSLHTYYVMAGETPVLVHNSACPELKLIHDEESFSQASLDFWRNQDTGTIVDSLRPGRPEALRVHPDGEVANGNTRLYILYERGYNVNALPREPYSGRLTSDEDYWNLEQ